MIDIIVVLIIVTILGTLLYTKIKKIKSGEAGGCSCAGGCDNSSCASSCKSEDKS